MSLTAGFVLAVLIAYVAGLFFIAQRGETARISDTPRARRVIYALSLTVYVTSWSYFAVVGEAARDGWSMLGFYLGPALAISLFAPVWRRVAIAAKREKVGSIADFLASRYGRSHALGAMVAAVSLIAALPHIALQLNALAIGWNLILTGHAASSSTSTVMMMAALLLLFAVLFGARHADLTAQNRGLLNAIAVQSVVKLLALVVVALFAGWLFVAHGWNSDTPGLLLRAIAGPETDTGDRIQRMASMTLLGFSALFCFPKQFHMGFVELREVNDISASRWILPLYLGIAALAVLPILLAGNTMLPAGLAEPALYALSLPLALDNDLLLALVAIGGFSAASSMVVAETIALSAMVSNDLLLPWITWRTQRSERGETNFSSLIVAVRRATMVVVLGAACLFVILNHANALRTIGLASFVAAAQTFPLVIGAVYWQRATMLGAMAGLVGGIAVWAWAGFALGVTGNLSPVYTRLDPLVFSIICSLGVNVVLFVGVSLFVPSRMIDRLTARSFVHGLDPAPRTVETPALRARADDLMRLVAHFLGEKGAREGFAQFSRETGEPVRPEDRVSPMLARAAERMLAGFIGAPSARSVIAVALAGPYGARADILNFLDDAMGAVEFSRGVLQSSLNSLPQGICVLDSNERVIAWNTRFRAMFALPSAVVALQRPWASVSQSIAAACIDGQAIGAIDRADPKGCELKHTDGRTIRASTAPMSGGGRVLSFADVTEDRAREAALQDAAALLEQANETLEARVRERTHDLETAKEQAERADLAKSRFLAAASHDLLQPLHAARLFIAALQEDLQDVPERTAMANSADRAIGSADRMLRALLNLSQLDAGGIKPLMRAVYINDLMVELHREFAQVAARKGLTLRMIPSTAWLVSDPDLLRSVLQNLVINAIRYTENGGVLIGCRNRYGHVRIEVWDSGRGIPEEALDDVFKEFVRLDRRSDEPGMGLGLAIVERVANCLGHGLHVHSVPDKGSVFGVTAQRAVAPGPRTASKKKAAPALSLTGLRVLCVDDDKFVLDGVTSLLTRWGASVTQADGWAACAALEGQSWEVALLDYHIGGQHTGLDLLKRLDHRIGCAAIVTATPDEVVRSAAAEQGAKVLVKPLDAETLRRFLADAYYDQLVEEPD